MRSILSAVVLVLTLTAFAPAQTGTFTTFGTGCAGTDGTPVLSSPDLPTVGKSFTLFIKLGKKSGRAFLIFGATRTDYKGLKLPFDMGPLGAKGCPLLVGFSVLAPMTLNAAGGGSNTFAIPNLAALVGVEFFNQYYVLDAKANALGGVTSNGGAAKVGK